jgi:signal transduction histidine kinase/integral membrane sensor domain MASE1
VRRLVRLIALTAFYVAAGKLGLELALPNDSATAVALPAGIAVGVLLRFGLELWPGVAAGAFILNLFTTGKLLSASLISVGNTLEALVAYGLVVRLAGGASAFERTNTAFRFSLLAAVIAPIVAASTGTLALLADGLVEAANARPVWAALWLGHGVGVVLAAPLIVMWSRPARRPWTLRRSLELGAALGVVSAVVYLAVVLPPSWRQFHPLPLLALPVLLSFRLGARETAAVTMLVSVVAIVGTLKGLGPFASSSPLESILFVQSFIGVWSVAVLAVSIEAETRAVVEADIRTLNEGLEQRVATRTEELSRLRDRLEEAQRVASFGSWEWDVPANTIWWSDELFRIFQVPRLEGRTYEDYLTLLHPDDRSLVQSVVGKALADRRAFSFEHRIVWRDGTVRTIQADGHVIADATGRAVRLVGTAHDVTDRRLAEGERLRRIREQAARVEAEDASRAKDEFLATLSHELRTPLNAALGWAHMLKEVLSDSAGRARASDAILRNLQAQARLVSDMMDVSAIALRTLRLETTRLVLQDVVRGAIDSVRDPATAQRVRIEPVLPPAPVHVVGDPIRLQQVVWNLVSNAAKFSRDQGTVTVTVCREGDLVRITVEDEGPGIDPAFLPHLFERFRQADSSVTRIHGGLGLGLAIARHLVEAHEGSISAANRPEGGAVFTVQLHAAPSESPGDRREGVAALEI